MGTWLWREFDGRAIPYPTPRTARLGQSSVRPDKGLDQRDILRLKLLLFPFQSLQTFCSAEFFVFDLPDRGAAIQLQIVDHSALLIRFCSVEIVSCP
jgi:hypothetical protein